MIFHLKSINGHYANFIKTVTTIKNMHATFDMCLLLLSENSETSDVERAMNLQETQRLPNFDL